MHDGREQDRQGLVEDLTRKLETESRKLGIPLELLNLQPVHVFHTDARKLREVLDGFNHEGARFVLVALVRETFYFEVKRYADELCMPTQCARYATIKKFPRNYDTSLLIKINMKMGGVNHTLAQRGNSKADVFQKPPQSISWMFDKPTMVVVSNREIKYNLHCSN